MNSRNQAYRSALARSGNISENGNAGMDKNFVLKMASIAKFFAEACDAKATRNVGSQMRRYGCGPSLALLWRTKEMVVSI